jgi:diacylglycerol kinase family enzyme
VERIGGYRRLRVTRASVTAEGAVPAHRDGDPETETERIEVSLEPRALTIVTPAATAADPTGPFAVPTPR